MIWSIIGITALAGMGGTGMGGLVSCLFRKDSSKTVSFQNHTNQNKGWHTGYKHLLS